MQIYHTGNINHSHKYNYSFNILVLNPPGWHAITVTNNDMSKHKINVLFNIKISSTWIIWNNCSWSIALKQAGKMRIKHTTSYTRHMANFPFQMQLESVGKMIELQGFPDGSQSCGCAFNIKIQDNCLKKITPVIWHWDLCLMGKH